jgi:hydroxymethylpyrimidine pyrophosphatase-like HAD family hydrolase
LKSGIRLVATDLDGTLLPLSGRGRAALRRVCRAGIAVVVVTGRPGRQTRAIVADFGVNRMAVCANGAEIYDLDEGTVVHRSFLSAATARQVIAGLRERVPAVRFAWEDSTGIGHDPYWNTPFVEPPVEVGDPAVLLNRPIGKLLVGHPDLGPADLAGQVRVDGLTLTWSTGPILEVLAPGVSKGSTLELLSAGFGLDAHQVMAIGDAENDLSMLAFAGCAVAMGNAPPAVRAAADLVTLRADQDGVAQVLEWLMS